MQHNGHIAPLWSLAALLIAESLDEEEELIALLVLALAFSQLETNRHGVMSECTALLSQKSGVGGVSDSGFSSCAVPTYYCGSEYFYNQHPQVWNLIGTECRLSRSEHRVKSK